MNILLLCNKLPYPANDGSSIAMARMIEGFLSQQAELTVLCLNTVKHHKQVADIPAKIAAHVTFEVIDVDTNPTVSGAFSNLFQRLPFHVSRFYQKSVSEKLNQIFANKTFDIIQFEGIFMMPYAKEIRQKSKAKTVLRTHNVEHQIWERTVANTTKPVLKTFLKTQTKKLKRYENFCAKSADAIVAISENDQKYFADFNKNTITIPCGIESVAPLKKLEPQQFFHLGAMDWLPNQQGVNWLLKEVWPLVLAQNKHAFLHLAGRAMDEKLKQTNLPNVTLYGEVDDAAAFRAAHGVMLVPLLAGSGIRIKIIEGLAEGIPVISTEIGAEGIPAENHKNIIFANTAQNFADAILSLANNPEKCQSIGKNAAILASEHFLNKNLAQRLMAFYSSTWQIS